MRIGHGNSVEIYMDENFLPERMNFWENVILNLTVPRHEYFIDVYEATNEYEENTKSSITMISPIYTLCITGCLLLIIITVVLKLSNLICNKK